MKNVIVRYGLFSTLLLLGLMSISFFTMDHESDFTTQEIIGYSSMIISMVFVYLGIKQHRDQNLNGSISFGKAFTTGLLIVIFPSVLFGAFDLFYTEVINPEFFTDYQAHYVEQMKSQLSEEDFKLAMIEMEQQMAMFGNPVMQFVLMGGTVYFIGIVASLLSAFILKQK